MPVGVGDGVAVGDGVGVGAGVGVPAAVVAVAVFEYGELPTELYAQTR